MPIVNNGKLTLSEVVQRQINTDWPAANTDYDLYIQDLLASGNVVANGLIIGNLQVSLDVLSGNSIASLTTEDIPETTNLYYTNTRVQSYLDDQGYVAGGGGGANLQASTTDDLAEGANNLYYTNARVEVYVDTLGYVSSIDLTGNTTTDLAEGTNLYYTNTRVQSYLDEQGYDANTTSNSGVVSYLTDQSITVLDLTVTGDLIVQGNTVTLNAATLTIEDKNILLANGAINAAAADGAGITIDGADANVIYQASGDKFVINKSLDILGNLNLGGGSGGSISDLDSITASNIIALGFFTGNLIGQVSDISNFTTSNLTEGDNLYYTNARVYSNVAPLLELKANVTDLTTSNVVELNNLYYTNARVSAYLAENDVTVGGNLSINGVLDTPNFSVSDTLTVGSQIIYAQGTNGFSVNEDFDPSSNALQTAYHFTSGAGRETVAFTLARTGQFTNGFGIRGTSADNKMVNFGEQNNTSFEWRNGVGIQPLNLGGGTLLANIQPNGDMYILGNVRAYQYLDYTGSVVGSSIDISGNTTTDLAEGTNLYYTNTRVQAYLDDSGYTVGGGGANLQTSTTDDLAEGSNNLYYTNTRVSAYLAENDSSTQNFTVNGNLTVQGGNTFLNISNLDVAGDIITGEGYGGSITGANLISANNITAFSISGTFTGNLIGQASDISNHSTSNLSEGTNLYYTNARVQAYITDQGIGGGANLQTSTTDDLAEGTTNLYYTNARVSAYLAETDITTQNLTVTGNLIVQGDTTTLNTATLVVEDKNIVLANGAPDASAADGAGITIDGAQANITYQASGDKFVINKTLDVSGYSVLTSNNTTTDLAEGNNLYYTNARVYSNVEPLLVLKANVVDLTTSNVTELDNLYFTNARVDSRIAETSINALSDVNITDIADGQTIVWDSASNTFIVATIAQATSANVANSVLTLDNFTTSNLIEGVNLYYTNTRVQAYLDTTSVSGSMDLSGNTTTDLAEGTNLYYTNARVQSYLDAEGYTFSYTVNDNYTFISSAGNLSYELDRNVTDPKNILVIIEGLIQIPTTDYSIVGSTLTFTTQPPPESNVEIRFFGEQAFAGATTPSFRSTVNTFTGNGANVDFTLSVIPPSKDHIMITIDGVIQQSSAYTLLQRTLSFTEAPEANAEIDVRIFLGSVGTSYNTRSYTGDGNTNTFVITSGFYNDTVLVFENGVAQLPGTDYVVSESNVIFSTAPSTNVAIQIRELGVSGQNLLSTISGYNQITGNLTPISDGVYSLGSITNRYKDLYLTGNTIILGDVALSASAGSLAIAPVVDGNIITANAAPVGAGTAANIFIITRTTPVPVLISSGTLSVVGRTGNINITVN